MTFSQPTTAQTTTSAVDLPDNIPSTPFATSRPIHYDTNTGTDNLKPEADRSSTETSDTTGEQLLQTTDASSQYVHPSAVTTDDESTVDLLHSAEQTTAMADETVFTTPRVSVEQKTSLTDDESATVTSALTVQTSTLLSGADTVHMSDVTGDDVTETEKDRSSWTATNTMTYMTTITTPNWILEEEDETEADDTKPGAALSPGTYANSKFHIQQLSHATLPLFLVLYNVKVIVAMHIVDEFTK